MAEYRPTTEVAEPDAVVVYDEHTGAVQHIHQEFTTPGTPGPAQADILTRALQLASEMAESDVNRPARLQALALTQEDRATLRQARGPVKVDLSTRRLVPVRG